MIPLAMIVLDELREHVPQVPLAERNDAIETLLLDRPDESLGTSIGVRRALRRQDHADASLAKPLAYHAAPLPIPITDQHAMTDQRAVIGRRHPTHELIHEQVTRVRRGPEHVDAPGGEAIRTLSAGRAAAVVSGDSNP
jgi:hypothetical protein